jgi:hypothetical protein
VTYPHPRSRIAAGLFGLVAVLLCGGCSDASLEWKASVASNLDDRLTIRGEICTSAPDPNEFPVKVVVIIDQSGSMCVSDPPGSQAFNGFCEQINPLVNPNGNLVPARARALTRLRDQFASQPNVQMAVIPFETNVGNVWPANGQGFAPAGTLDDAYIANLQNTLGKGTDYEGALSEAYTRITDDIAASPPDRLPRTRYVVVFLTDGTPYPRCAAIDTLSVYADPYNPDLTWEDQVTDYCNVIVAGTTPIANWTPGTDRNQNYQLFALVDRIVNLKNLYNIGDVRLHSVLLFNEEAVRACGTICQDIYGVYPNVAAADYPAAAHAVARFVLSRMAQRGNGIFQEFINGDISTLSLGALDYTSMISPNVMKALIVQALRSEPDGEKRVLDSDGDGVPDETDNSFTLGTNKFNVDTDADSFTDAFELLHKDNGFKGANDPDTRGCDAINLSTGLCKIIDTDGDGLGLKAEEYLGSKAGLTDTDSDGIPDGVEARYGLDPTVSNLGQDTDGDGISDVDEIEKGSNPIVQDRVFYEGEGYQYEIQATPRADGSVCYQFAVSNLKLLTPPQQAANNVNMGFNLFKVWFAESPESAISLDYGYWRTACAWARFQPPSIRQPTGPELNLARTDTLANVPRGFGAPQRMTNLPDPVDYTTPGVCAGTPP